MTLLWHWLANYYQIIPQTKHCAPMLYAISKLPHRSQTRHYSRIIRKVHSLPSLQYQVDMMSELLNYLDPTVHGGLINALCHYCKDKDLVCDVKTMSAGYLEVSIAMNDISSVGGYRLTVTHPMGQSSTIDSTVLPIIAHGFPIKNTVAYGEALKRGMKKSPAHLKAVLRALHPDALSHILRQVLKMEHIHPSHCPVLYTLLESTAEMEGTQDQLKAVTEESGPYSVGLLERLQPPSTVIN